MYTLIIFLYFKISQWMKWHQNYLPGLIILSPALATTFSAYKFPNKVAVNPFPVITTTVIPDPIFFNE